jgi:hypothetical protein
LNSSASSLAIASDKIKRLPLQDVGLTDIAGIPYILNLTEPLHTALRMAGKEAEIIPAKYGFTDTYTIKGVTASAYEFMFGKQPSQVLSHLISALRHTGLTDSEGALKAIYSPGSSQSTDATQATVDPSALSHLSLESPEQFAMGWTQYQGISILAEPYLAGLVASLTSVFLPARWQE